MSDGRSAEIFHEEILTEYDYLAAGGDPAEQSTPTQYSQFARWRSEQLSTAVREAQLAFWRSKLEGASPDIALAPDRPRESVGSFSGVRLRRELPAAVATAVRRLGRDHGVTEFVVLHCALALALGSAPRRAPATSPLVRICVAAPAPVSTT